MVTSFRINLIPKLEMMMTLVPRLTQTFLIRMSHHLVEPFDSMNYLWFGQRNFSNWVEQDLSYNQWCYQQHHLVVSWPSCLNNLLVEQAVVCPAAAIHKWERNSMDFDLNVKFQVGWDNTQYIPTLYHHKDKSILDPRNTLHLLPHWKPLQALRVSSPPRSELE